MTHKKQAFTLIELIVVITILVILGTIAFLSFQGYSKSSRDSVRVSDINAMKKSLELLSIQTGKYPIPSNPTDFTYSGGIVWKQGTFGESVLSQVEKLNKLPKDPLSEVEYTYSVTNTQKEFEIGSIFEGDAVSQIIGETYAVGTREATAYVTGNYNGLITKVSTGGTIYILAVPSIISRTTNQTDVSNLITSNQLVFNGYANLPSSYLSSVFNIEGGFENNQTQVEIYSGNALPEQSDLVSIMTDLEAAYSGTLLADTSYIDQVIEANLSGNENIINDLAAEIINASVGAEVKVVDVALVLANGTCGSDNGKSLISTPTNLCSVGNPTSVTDHGVGDFFMWSCNGVNGGTNTNCVANHINNPFTFDEGTKTITAYDVGVGGLTPTIPDTINGVNVEVIGEGAFNNKGLTSVTLGANVITISQNAFRNNQLTTVIIQEGTTTIGGYAFDNNKITSLTLPSTIGTIGAGAFNLQQGIAGVVYGPSSGYVRTTYENNPGGNTFDKSGLYSISAYRWSCSAGACTDPNYTFDETTTTITRYNGAAGSVSVPSTLAGMTVTGIGTNAFEQKGITSLILPSTLTSIGYAAFQSNNFNTLVIPNSVTSLGGFSFNNSNIVNLTLGSGITTIPDSAFRNNNMVTLVIPSGVTTIGNYAFDANDLVSLTLPSTLASIGTRAFYGQNGVAGVVYGPSSGYVRTTYENNPGGNTFDKNGLYSLSAYRWSCGAGACADADYTFDETTTTITRYNGAAGSVTIPSSIAGMTVTGIGSNAFEQKGITSLTLPSTLTSIGYAAFQNNNFNTLVIPNSITSLADNAFNNSNIVNLTIGSGITTIPQNAFRNNDMVTLVIPSGVTTIGNYAFDTNDLESLTLPSTLASIGTRAFYGQNGVAGVVYGPSSGYVRTTYENNPGGNTFDKNGLYSLSAYRWSCGAGACADADYTFDETTTTITRYNGAAGSVTIPSSIAGMTVTGIGSNAFEQKGITSLTLPSTITSIGYAGFQSNNFNTLVIPNSVTSLGDFSFNNSNIVNLTIGSGITTIPDSAFRNNDLGTFIVPSGVTTIGNYSFDSNNLTSLTLPSTVSSIGTRAFYQQAGAGMEVHGPATPHYVATTWSSNPGGNTFDKDGAASYVADQ